MRPHRGDEAIDDGECGRISGHAAAVEPRAAFNLASRGKRVLALLERNLTSIQFGLFLIERRGTIAELALAVRLAANPSLTSGSIRRARATSAS